MATPDEVNEQIKLIANLKQLKGSLRDEVFSSELTTREEVSKLILLGRICTQIRDGETHLAALLETPLTPRGTTNS